MENLPLIKDVSLFLDDKPSVYALRKKAKDALLCHGFPTLKNESWKYTDVKPIINTDFIIDTLDKVCGHNCCEHKKTDEAFIEIKFCHGKLHIEEFNLPYGLEITPLPLALYENEYKSYLFHAFDLEKHPFAALNGAYLEQGLCIRVLQNIRLDKPIIVKYNQTHCEEQQIHLHNIIVLEKNSSVELLEDYYANEDEKYLLTVVNEVYLKPQSSLIHYKKQGESTLAYHIALNAIKVQNDASYTQFYLANGGKLCRQETLVNLEHLGAAANVFSAYSVTEGCLSDITTNINHNAEKTYSNQFAKAVLKEDSTAVFQGKIHIAQDAQQTEGYQLHKALYLSDDADLRCKPELEIYADNIKCSHGASCGELDKEQLFYLTSRGIDKDTAKQLLIQAHLTEISALIKNEQIRNYLELD